MAVSGQNSPWRSLPVPPNHHSCNSFSVALNVKCIDLPLEELVPSSQERWSTHTHSLTLPFWNSHHDGYFQSLSHQQKPVSEVSACPQGICCLDLLGKNTLLTAWASGLGAGSGHSPEKGQELEGSSGHPTLSCAIHVSCSQVPGFTNRLFLSFFLYMLLLVKHPALLPPPSYF